MKIENWCGYEIRFVERDGEWWAVLKDICDALELRTDKVASRLNPNMLDRVPIDVSNNPKKGVRSKGQNKTRNMLIVNEFGIYEALYSSRKLEARKFRNWTHTVIQKLRRSVGLQGYEVMRMTEKDIQDQIDWMLDAVFYDEERKELMVSVTVHGGDTDQIPLDEYLAD